jgi:hypothetical protein
MKDKRLLALSLLGMILLGLTLWLTLGRDVQINSETDPSVFMEAAEPSPEGILPEDMPPEDNEAEPSEAQVEEVRNIELELSDLGKNQSADPEEQKRNLTRVIELIDRLLQLHPMTSPRYAELLEERFGAANSLMANAPKEEVVKSYKQNLALARDFAAKQPDLPVAHEILGSILAASNDSEVRASATTEFRECLRLEPTNARCKRMAGKPH